MLIFALMFFAPIPFKVHFNLDLSQLVVRINIKVFGLTFANEQLFVSEEGLQYRGTVDGYLPRDKNSSQLSKALLQSVTVDSFLVYLRHDLSNLNVYLMLAQNAILSMISQLVCLLSSCQFLCICNNFASQNNLQVNVKASISVAELSSCFIKQGVQKCKHKLAK